MTEENKTGTELTVLMNIEKQFNRLSQGKIKRHSEDAMKWFSRYIPRSYNNVKTSVMFRDRKLWTAKIKIGQMYFFEYDALLKDKLPIWDRYPIIFPFNTSEKDGVSYIHAINLHYLPPAIRLKVMIELLKLRNEKRYRKSTRLQLEWELLKNIAGGVLGEQCVHTYRFDQMVSTFVEIPSQSWSIAVFLPLQRWVINKNKGGKKPWGSRAK